MNKAIAMLIGLALLQGCGSYRDGPVLAKTQFESGVTVTIQAYVEGDVTHPIFLKAITADGSEVESAPFLYLGPSDVEAKNVPVEVKEVGNYIVVLDKKDPARALALACPKTHLVYPKRGDPTTNYLNTVDSAIREIRISLGSDKLERQ